MQALVKVIWFFSVPSPVLSLSRGGVRVLSAAMSGARPQGVRSTPPYPLVTGRGPVGSPYDLVFAQQTLRKRLRIAPNSLAAVPVQLLEGFYV